MKNAQSIQESCGKDQGFTIELKSHYIVYLHHMLLDLKQCDIMNPPYVDAHISDLSDSEEDVQPPHGSLEAEQKVYFSMAKNEQDSEVKHPSQFCSKYRCLLKHNCVIVKLTLSIAPTQVENERDFSIAGVFNQEQ